MSEPMTELSKRRRPWFSISLRAMMLLILVVGGLMGWKARRASLQRHAVAAVEAAGGRVTYDFEDTTRPLPFVPATEPDAPRWLRDLLGDEYFREIIRVERLCAARDLRRDARKRPGGPGTGRGDDGRPGEARRPPGA